MTSHGLIRRDHDPDDGCRVLVSLTEEGLAFLDDRRRTGEEWPAQCLEERFAEQERQRLVEELALLDRLTPRNSG